MLVPWRVYIYIYLSYIHAQLSWEQPFRTGSNAFQKMKGQPNPGRWPGKRSEYCRSKMSQSGGPLDMEPQKMEHKRKIE